MPVTVPPQPVYKTGKAGSLVVINQEVFISKWDVTVEKTWADATDSSGFDPTNQQLWKKQAAGAIQASGTMEGFFDFLGSSVATLQALLADTAIAAIFNLDRDTPFFAGLINIENFKSGIETEGGTTIGFSCDWKSYGVPTLYAGP